MVLLLNSPPICDARSDETIRCISIILPAPLPKTIDASLKLFWETGVSRANGCERTMCRTRTENRLLSALAEIPAQYEHGAKIPAMLTVFDQTGRNIRFPSGPTAAHDFIPAARKLKTLFESRDPIRRRR